MTEQDAPTVARATLWLDTSNEAMTRRSERLDGHPTLAFEPPLPAPAFTGAAPPPTQPLERSNLVAALESHETSQIERSGMALSDRAHGRPWSRAASHAAAFMLGGACVLLVLGVRPSAAPRRDAVTAHPGRATAIATPRAVAPTADVRKDPPVPAQLGLALAVDALARGDYPAAYAQYAALARQRPNDAALCRIAARLAARSGESRAGGGSEEAPCAR